MNIFYKQIVSLILVLVFLLQIFSKAIILVHFEMNRDYIAKNLCVKKEEPENCCKGSCHLKKELDKEGKKEQSPANPLKEKEEIQFFSQNNSHIHLLVPPTTNKLTTYYSNPLSEKHLHSIFRPPKSC